MRLMVGLAFIAIVSGLQPSHAGDCIISGPPPRLDSQPIQWMLDIASGQRCLRGLRSAAMTLDQVAIQSSPRHGEAAVQGYGFSYAAPRDFKGEDIFSVLMVGRYRGVQGSSIIHVQVNIR